MRGSSAGSRASSSVATSTVASAASTPRGSRGVGSASASGTNMEMPRWCLICGADTLPSSATPPLAATVCGGCAARYAPPLLSHMYAPAAPSSHSWATYQGLPHQMYAGCGDGWHGGGCFPSMQVGCFAPYVVPPMVAVIPDGTHQIGVSALQHIPRDPQQGVSSITVRGDTTPSLQESGVCSSRDD